MEKETLLQVIYALIGEIEPVSESAIDWERLENVQLLISVVDEIHTKLSDIARININSPYASKKE